MELFSGIIEALSPLMLLAIGAWSRYFPPRSINTLAGYRTARSMASQEAWDYAHRQFGILTLRCGAVFLGAALVLHFLVPVGPEVRMLVGAFGLIAVLIVELVVIERKLAQKFE